MTRSFIDHTLKLLEDAGLSVRYPEVRHVMQEPGGTIRMHSCFFVDAASGRRASIEQNLQMKFMMVFGLLDFYLDSCHLGLEGKSFRQKYLCLPAQGDYDLMLRQLFRITKLIRNALIHNPSSFMSANGWLDVSYHFRGTEFSIKISHDALVYLQTAICMYVKGDMGKGSYFLGIMRSTYRNMVDGIQTFSDDIGGALEIPSHGVALQTIVREIHVNPRCETNGGRIRFLVPKRKKSAWEGWDFYVHRQGNEYLVPMEAMDEGFSMDEQILIRDWKREGSFPGIRHP